MVKFLTGPAYDGSQVPVCTYWSTEATTNKLEDFAELEPGAVQGNCIANHFFDRSDISCFNDGQCNGEGKCLPCTKYKYGGMRLGISHSPPTDFLREFNKGLTDNDILSLQLRAVGSPVSTVSHDQLPFHIMLRNIQAEVAKCCRWSIGDGAASRFLITRIIGGPDTITVTLANGSTSQLQGIRVNNSVFPDSGTDTNPEGGSFFPVGLTVVAGWEDEPSFYLEPRTGLVKNGEGVVFNSSGSGNSSASRAKQISANAPKAGENGLSAITYCKNQAIQLFNREVDYFNNIAQSNAPAAYLEAAQARLDEKQAALDAVTAAEAEATTIKGNIDSQAAAVAAASTPDAIFAAASTLATTLDSMADQVDIANQNAGGAPAADTAAGASRILRSLAQQLRFSGNGGFTKCELAYTDENNAAQWNSPEDGSLPCNGMRSDCPFYTGPTWQFATTEKMEVGKGINAEAVQEIRFYSDDWARYSNPEEEFKTRFSTPFIWAFKDYIDAGGTPDVEDMILYRPKTMFARQKGNFNAPDDNPDTLLNAFETMRVDKVQITDFDNFEIGKTTSRIQPGQQVLDVDQVPAFATTIDEFSVPVATRLRITHPPTDENFIYRTWSPRFTNRISLWGTGSPNQTIYLVNNTALQQRDRYLDFFNAKNIYDVPSGGLPGANSNFNGILASQLKDIFDELEQEKSSNQSEAILGFDIVSSDTTGFWNSLIEVDLAHNRLNTIYAFILINDFEFVFDTVVVDHRVLHAWVTQDSYTGVDMTIHDVGGPTGGSKLGIATGGVAQESSISASVRQVLGRELVTVDHGYYAWRFKDRGLRFGSANSDSDLEGDGPVVESNANAFIANVGYRVVQYREVEDNVEWYLIQDCGIIMVKMGNTNCHRVLPLPDTSGELKALSPVLVNNGATGSVVAQWAPEKITLNVGGEEKDMVLIYRSEEGIGLPANYMIIGPAPGAENLFGRPDPDNDTVKVEYTYLRGQSHKLRSADAQSEPEGSGEVVTDNFYGDQVREHTQAIQFNPAGLVAGGQGPDLISLDQQDYCFVFKDSEGRPIGRKVVRFMISYYNLACVSVEIFYSWRSNCVTYALVPDLFLAIGTGAGQTSSPPKASVNPTDLQLGFRVASLLGDRPCGQTANCGDHEILRLGPLRKEFEIIANVSQGEGEEATVVQKAFFPSAGQAVAGEIISAEPPGSQWQLKRGTLWYPYDVCERPRYRKNTNGPLKTDTTELINSQTGSAGVATGSFGAGTFNAGQGEFGGLPPRSDEAYRGYDDVSAKVLDTHPSLRPCTSAFTYGNVVRKGGNEFTGYARRRGEVDTFWYTGFQWEPPPFGNFGRPLLLAECSHKIGDYSSGNERVGFRWMPIFPEREDMGGTTGLFSEGPDPEPVIYRLLGSQSPAGGVGESTPADDTRYIHDRLIGNRSGTVSYPHVPYWQQFLPDNLLGLDPSNRGQSPGGSLPGGTISTGWAWREQDQPIRRGQQGTSIMRGLKVALPDYFLNNQRMEVRIRPAEGFYSISFAAPQYNEDGSVNQNGMLQIGDGPPVEIIIDFSTRTFGLANQPDTVYDTSLILGEGPFECENRFSSNPSLSVECGCEGTTDEDSEQAAAIFIHGDSLAPPGFFALYTTTELSQPFPTDLPGTDPNPVNRILCNYFIPHIFFSLDSTFLPITEPFDPFYSNEVTTQYTWSRVPHGFLGGSGRGENGGQEPRAQDYRDPGNRSVLKVRPFNNQRSLSRTLITAYFPSSDEAAAALQDSTGIIVPAFLQPGDPKLLPGAVPATNGRSQGQNEQITLDMTFNTFVRVKQVRLWFLAGKGMQVPTVILTGIPTELRTGNFSTIRSGRILGQSQAVTNGTDIPGSNDFSAEDIQNGEALFNVTITPAISSLPFWDQFYQEYHLIFAERSSSLSMGIYGIEFEVEALLPSSTVNETIFVPERRYYRSTFSPANKNPEEFLQGVDNASAYWRSTAIGADSGGNRFRSYAWGEKINDETGVGQGGGQPTIPGEVEELEQLQAEEYNKARSLLGNPYVFSFTSFIPLDEQRWLEFLGGSQPSWSTTLTNRCSDIDQVTNEGTENLTYGAIPERTRWNAPGHSWIHTLEEEAYNPCCDGCGYSMLVNYEFIHLHDQLAVVETAAFWDEMPSGLLKGVRSIMEQNPDIRVLNENELTDGQGDPIPADVLEESGIARDADTGQLIIQ